jgi:hypothetical protein
LNAAVAARMVELSPASDDVSPISRVETRRQAGRTEPRRGRGRRRRRAADRRADRRRFSSRLRRHRSCGRRQSWTRRFWRCRSG